MNYLFQSFKFFFTYTQNKLKLFLIIIYFQIAFKLECQVIINFTNIRSLDVSNHFMDIEINLNTRHALFYIEIHYLIF